MPILNCLQKYSCIGCIGYRSVNVSFSSWPL